MACRTARAKAELLRIVRTPGGSVQVDRSGRLAGRGAYVCPVGDCLLIALDRGALRRALEIPITAEMRSALLTAATTETEQGGARGQE